MTWFTDTPASKADEVAKRIQFQRWQRQWTQADLAQRLGVSQPCLSRWENGQRRVTVSDLARLAAIFRCTWNDLLGPAPDGVADLSPADRLEAAA